MADLAYTAAKVRNASPVGQSEVWDIIAGVAIEAGQGVYINSSGLGALADASAAGTAVCIGVALNDAQIGQVVAVLHKGFVEGFTLSQAYQTLIFVSDTAGDFADAAGTVTAPVGRVMPASDSAYTKLLYIDCGYNMNVLPA
jgi:hypothetical protein